MPLISIDAVHPTKEQKEKLIAGLTKTASEILGVGGKTLAQFLAEQKK